MDGNSRSPGTIERASAGRSGGNPQSGAREGSLADDGRENDSLRLNL